MTTQRTSGRNTQRVLRPLVSMLFLVGAMTASCGDDTSTTSTSTSTQPTTTAVPTTAAPTTAAPTTAAPTTAAPTTAVPSTTPGTSTPVVLEQPAIWPASDIAFATPEQAAVDFVAQVLGVPPELGAFMAGDSRSGEIEVFSPGEGGPGSRVVRSLLLLRQLGPDHGWFVTAAVSDGVTIIGPEHAATVPPGDIEVTGLGRGFEATLIVKAFIAGEPTPIVDPVIAAGGALETPEPYTATIDLRGVADVASGSTVTILVRGDTGLETDPGEFSAIAVTIG